MPSAAGSGPSAKGKQAMAGSFAASGPSQARSSSGALPEEASRRRLHRSDGTPVMEPAAKHQRTAEDAGQGSSRAPDPRGTPGVAAPPPPPPGDASPRQQQQQQQPRVAPPPPPREQQQQEQPWVEQQQLFLRRVYVD